MRSSIVCLLVAPLLFVVSASAQAASPEGAPRNVILFGWDGAQWAHVQECLERAELPTLKKLISASVAHLRRTY